MNDTDSSVTDRDTHTSPQWYLKVKMKVKGAGVLIMPSYHLQETREKCRVGDKEYKGQGIFVCVCACV